jgi:hypothetical protein
MTHIPKKQYTSLLLQSAGEPEVGLLLHRAQQIRLCMLPNQQDAGESQLQRPKVQVHQRRPVRHAASDCTPISNSPHSFNLKYGTISPNLSCSLFTW